MIIEEMDCYYDYDTTNVSFVEFSEFLKNKDMKDYRKPIFTLDKSLKGVNPFDENLSEDIQRKIIRECRNNYWYFFRECVEYHNPWDGKSKFKLDIGSYAAITSILDTKKHVLYKAPRQTRATLNMLTILLYHNFADMGTIPIRSNTQENTWMLVSKLINLIHVPLFMKKTMLTVIDSMYESGEFYKTGVFIDNTNFDKDKIDTIDELHDHINVKTRIIGIQSSSTITDTRFERWELQKVNHKSNTIMIFITKEDLGLSDEWYAEMCKLLQNDPDLIKREINLI